MELLVATLVYTTQGRDTDTISQVHQLASTLRSAPGLINTRIYRSRGPGAYYLMLTNWEKEDLWRKAQGRYDPRQSLLKAKQDLFASPPEQWLMYYLWGYSRPAGEQQYTTLNLLTTHSGQGESAKQHWLEMLQQQSIEPRLAFSFLARGTKEEPQTGPQEKETLSALKENIQQGTTFLNLLSWQTESQRMEFYSSPRYQKTERLLNTIGTMQVLILEAL